MLFKEIKIRDIYIAFSLLIFVIIIGTIGFMFFETYTFVNALFMTVITISTVGFEVVDHPLSAEGKLFTIGLIIISFGILAYVAKTIAHYIFDGIFSNFYKNKKMQKRIQKLDNHVVICGYGRNGRQAAIELRNHNEPFVIVEKNINVISKIKEETDYLYVVGDSTQDEVLEAAFVNNAKAVITTLPKDADNIYVVLTARELSSTVRIISRASDEHADSKLRKAGATNIIMPDMIGGQRMAKLVAQPDVIEFLEYLMLQGKNVKLEEVSCSSETEKFVAKTIREFNIRETSGANIVGLKRNNGEIIFNPSPDITLVSSDKLFVIGNDIQILNLKKVLFSCEN